VRGPKMFTSYLHNKAATDEAIDRDGWLLTGDIGHYDEKERLFITDRIKEMIKLGPIQVSPTEIELYLLTHPCVAEVAVVGVRHETEGQWPRAYVKRRDGMDVTEQELRKYIADSLAEPNQLRAGVVFVDHIPRTTIGKVDRKYFKKLTDFCTSKSLTVAELLTKANALAQALVDRGVNKSHLIVTLANTCVEHAVLVFASIFLGITLYPITPIANVHELQTILPTLGSIAVFVDTDKAELMDKVLTNTTLNIDAKWTVVLDGVFKKYITFDELLKEGQNRSLPKIPHFPVDPEKDIYVLLQSSGTSGIFKSVQISHRAFVANIYCDIYHRSQHLDPLIFSEITPFGSISGQMFLFKYLLIGSTFVVYSRVTEDNILKSIEKYKINTLFISPLFGSRLISEKYFQKYDLSSVKLIMTSGAAFPAPVATELVTKHGVVLREGYGMTEYAPITHWQTCEPWEFIPGSMGYPSYNTEIKVIDVTTGDSLPTNTEGQICVRGPKLFTSYLHNKAATDETIDKDGWLLTGDIGHYDEKDRLFITDRIKEMIKWTTIQVSPTEIELFLLTHPCVAEVAVIGVRHQTENQWPRAYVKRREGMDVTEQQLCKYVGDSLGVEKQLRAGVVFVDHIPRTTIGKVDRKYFKQLVSKEILTG
ncbi:unnamed protein product, partial [Oppiella nova]